MKCAPLLTMLQVVSRLSRRNLSHRYHDYNCTHKHTDSWRNTRHFNQLTTLS